MIPSALAPRRRCCSRRFVVVVGVSLLSAVSLCCRCCELLVIVGIVLPLLSSPAASLASRRCCCILVVGGGVPPFGCFRRIWHLVVVGVVSVSLLLAESLCCRQRRLLVVVVSILSLYLSCRCWWRRPSSWLLPSDPAPRRHCRHWRLVVAVGVSLSSALLAYPYRQRRLFIVVAVLGVSALLLSRRCCCLVVVGDSVPHCGCIRRILCLVVFIAVGVVGVVGVSLSSVESHCCRHFWLLVVVGGGVGVSLLSSVAGVTAFSEKSYSILGLPCMQ